MDNEKNKKYAEWIKSVNTIMYNTFGPCSWRWITSSPMYDIQANGVGIAAVTVPGSGNRAQKVQIKFDEELRAVKIEAVQPPSTNEAVEITLDKDAAANIAYNYISDNLMLINELCQDAISNGDDYFYLMPDDNRPAILKAMSDILTSDWHNYQEALICEGQLKVFIKLNTNTEEDCIEIEKQEEPSKIPEAVPELFEKMA